MEAAIKVWVAFLIAVGIIAGIALVGVGFLVHFLWVHVTWR